MMTTDGCHMTAGLIRVTLLSWNPLTLGEASGEGPMEHALDSELDYILKYRVLQTLYQPVLDSGSGRVFGYEALVRGPSNSPLHAPLPLIRAASRAGRLFELDLVCRELAIRRFRELDLSGRLFLNVSPLSLMEPTFRPGETLRLLHEVGLPPQRVVVELTEQQ